MEQDGSMKLIDTRDSAFSDLDSIFLPGTFIPQRARLGNDGVFERSTVPNKSHWPMLTLDYRCHTPGGYIGKRFPKKASAHASRKRQLSDLRRVGLLCVNRRAEPVVNLVSVDWKYCNHSSVWYVAR
jgi:hypothetical protein